MNKKDFIKNFGEEVCEILSSDSDSDSAKKSPKKGTIYTILNEEDED